MKYILSVMGVLVIATAVFVGTRPSTSASSDVLPVKPHALCQALQSFDKAINLEVKECK
jgi:hypothetical protein